jgi:hypothetical protein
MPVNIPKSLSYDQLPESNMVPVKIGDSISLVTFKLPAKAHTIECDYIYSHERLGKVLSVENDGSFTAQMESISGNVTRDYTFTVKHLNKVKFGRMAHVIYNLTN